MSTRSKHVDVNDFVARSNLNAGERVNLPGSLIFQFFEEELTARFLIPEGDEAEPTAEDYPDARSI